ncbi:MAG TPA: MFS transporter [Gemmatimonadaceae bacterium]|nr:MFS transporter [Gemmatimonadaceae bacterium]
MALTTEPTENQTKRPLSEWPFSFLSSALNPWRGLSGLPREVWLLFITNLVNRAGMMVLPFLVLYLTRELGFTAGQAGLIFAVYGATAIVTGPIAGRLSDRLGAVQVMRASLVSSGLVLFAFSFARSYAAVVIATIGWSACAEMFRPASYAALTHVVPAARLKPAFAVNRLAINLGMSIGPALGGFLATVSFRSMFVVDGATTIIAGLVLTFSSWRMMGDTAPSQVSGGDRESPRTIFHDRPFVIFLLASMLVCIVFFQHEAALPLYLVQWLHLSPAFYGMLFTINTLLIVALEVPITTATAHWSNTFASGVGCTLFAVGFGALAVVGSSAGVLATVVVWTFGEMLLFPAMSAHLGQIAPENRRGVYMGAYTTSMSIALTIGPPLGTQILGAVGPVAVWTTMFALGALSALLMVYAAPDRRSPAAVVAGS